MTQASEQGEWRTGAAMACFFAFMYGLYGLFRHWQFGSSAYDLGIFDQAIWHLSRLETPASTVRGVSNLLGDHFHPAIALFAPLYWIAPAPEVLIAAQAVLFGASLIPVYLFLRDRLGRREAIALSTAYGFFWGLQRAAAFDVHEIAFAPPLIATAILAMDRRKWLLFWFAAVALIFVKEDLIPLLTFFGFYLVIRGDRRQGMCLVVLSLLVFLAIVGFVIPSMNESGQFEYSGTYDSIRRSPWRIPFVLFSPATKFETFMLWLLPFALLPLASPLSLLLIPFMLSRFLSESPTHWGTTFHYTAPLAPILATSAGDGLARIAARVRAAALRRRVLIGFSAASVVLSLFLPGNQPFWKLFRPSYYQSTPALEAGYRALRLVPGEASVVAQGVVVPHISHRDRVYMLDAKARDADYVIAVMHLSPWPNANADELRAHLDSYLARGYTTTFDEHGWIVLRRE